MYSFWKCFVYYSRFGWAVFLALFSRFRRFVRLYFCVVVMFVYYAFFCPLFRSYFVDFSLSMNILTIHRSLGPFYLVMFCFCLKSFSFTVLRRGNSAKTNFFIRFELMTLLMMSFCLFATVTVKPNDKQLLRICRMIYLCALVRSFRLFCFEFTSTKQIDGIKASKKNIAASFCCVIIWSESVLYACMIVTLIKIRSTHKIHSQLSHTQKAFSLSVYKMCNSFASLFANINPLGKTNWNHSIGNTKQ